MDELKNCWNCKRFSPLKEEERNDLNDYAVGGCAGHGLMTEKEAEVGCSDCYEPKEQQKNELQVTKENLPQNIEDLSKFVLVGREKLVAVRAEIRAIDKVGLAKEVRKQKLQEAQKIADVVTEAEVKIGELINAIPKESGGDHGNQYTSAKKFPEAPFGKNEKVTAKAKEIMDAGISEKQAKQFVLMAKNKDVVEQAKAQAKSNDDIVSRSLVLNMIKDKQKEQKREERAERKQYQTPNQYRDSYKLYTADIKDGLPMVADESVDFIITDPPYPKEYLYCFYELAKVAKRVLKKGGSLIVMSGQSYLPEVYKRLCSTGLNYQWTLCYSMPGQSTTLWTRKVGTHWKPLIWLTKGEYKGDFADDIVKSDLQDKTHHEWGQSESGIQRILEKFTYPKDTILDPFLGGGTTGVVAVAMDRKFIGADIDKECVAKTEERINEL